MGFEMVVVPSSTKRTPHELILDTKKRNYLKHPCKYRRNSIFTLTAPQPISIYQLKFEIPPVHIRTEETAIKTELFQEENNCIF